MRTRIALVAITPIAVITVSTLVQAATEQSTGANPAPSSAAPAHRATRILPDQLDRLPRTAHQRTRLRRGRGLFTDVSGALLLHTAVRRRGHHGGGATPAPASRSRGFDTRTRPPRPPSRRPRDTVTPDQRAAWERVAMCEEGGDWTVRRRSRSAVDSGSPAPTGTPTVGPSTPRGAEATEDQQIMVAERIQSSPPDQYGCQGW